MTISKKLREMLKEAIKSNDIELKENIRLVLGEFDRISKSISDEDEMKVLHKLKNSEIEILGYSGETTSSLLEFVKPFLPNQIGEEDIIKWINDNVNFSLLKNKNQAIGMVARHFGKEVDGKMVKKIIEEKF